MTASDLTESSNVPSGNQTEIKQNQKVPVSGWGQPSQWWPGLLVAVVALLLFALTRYGNFQADDFTLLGQLRGNKKRLGDTLGFFVSDWGLDGKFYAPLPRLFFYLEYTIFQITATYWHLISAMLHTGAAWLVWLLVRRLLHRDGVAMVAGLFFAVFPVHVNVVAQVVGQADLLATIFCLASAINFIAARQNLRLQLSPTGTVRSYWLSVVFFGLALLCRQEAVALPLILLAYDFISGGLDRILHQETDIEAENDQHPSSGHLLGYYLPFLGLVVFYLLLNLALLGGLSAYFPPANAPVTSNPASARTFSGTASEAVSRNDLGIGLRSNLRMVIQPFSLGGTDGLILLAALAAFLALTGVQEWEAWLINHPQIYKLKSSNHAGSLAVIEDEDEELSDLPVNPLDTVQNGTRPVPPVKPDYELEPEPVETRPTEGYNIPPATPEPVEPALVPVQVSAVSPATGPELVEGELNQPQPLSLKTRPSYWTLRSIAFGFMWTAACVLPFVLSLPSERTLYLASVGFAIFLAAALTPFGLDVVDKAVDRHQARALFGPFELSFILRVVAIIAVFVVYFTTSVQAIDEWNKTTRPFTALLKQVLGLA